MKEITAKKIEFHVHTIYSKDSLQTFPFMLLACKLKKIDCLAITDHNEIKGAIIYQKKFKKYNIDVIVGEEIFTKDGEIIGLYLNKKIEPGLSAIETVNEIRKQSGLVYIPHPYDLKRIKTVLKSNALDLIKNDVDFIECHNGRNIDKEFSTKQNEIAEKYSKIKIVGSDAHTSCELGRNYVLVDKYSRNTLKEDVENGTLVKAKYKIFSHFITKIDKTLKMIFKGDFYGIYRIIKRKIGRS